MILLSEVNMVGEEHLSFNSAFVKKIRETENVVLFCEENHSSKLDVKLIEKITFKETTLKGHVRDVFRFWLVLRSFYLCKKRNIHELIFLSLHPLSQIYLSILSHFFTNTSIKLVLHGELESFVPQSPYKLRRSLLKLAFILRNKNIKYIVLGEHIKHKLVFNKILSQDDVIAINHPFIFDFSSGNHMVFSKTIKFGCLGVANLNKGVDKLFLIANKFNCFTNNVSFHLVGKLTPSILPYINDNVSYIDSEVMIPKDDYMKMIKDLDYILFFYDINNYQMTASGALFDALNAEKPLVYLNNTYFSSIINKYNFCVGYPCENIEQLEDVISKLVSTRDVQDYMFMKENIVKLKKILSSEKISLN
ncbi:hypothetical protein [Shewanella sp. DW31]|uniref:hypothetical protein n=1 Tax=Shewanella sp. DW31 TaxID=2699422 RepID=UPI0018E3E8D3|nr:hypothetical protein [Shewanella sp. DW31]MBI1674392.1 hypothetical protein [Shewanella sp. DW31]